MKIDYLNLHKKLESEISKAAHLITEDLIRHWFINTQGLNVKATEIEKPYSTLNKKSVGVSVGESSRLDLFYEQDGTAIEFKCHRRTYRSANCTTTKAGSVFRDFNRLSTIDYKDKYLIYLLDSNMCNYYKKRDYNNLFIKASKGELLDCADFDNDLRNVLGSEFIKGALTPFGVSSFSSFAYKIKIEYAKPIKNGFYLAGFKIL